MDLKVTFDWDFTMLCLKCAGPWSPDTDLALTENILPSHGQALTDVVMVDATHT
jgi:hypothetical protein